MSEHDFGHIAAREQHERRLGTLYAVGLVVVILLVIAALVYLL